MRSVRRALHCATCVRRGGSNVIQSVVLKMSLCEHNIRSYAVVSGFCDPRKIRRHGVVFEIDCKGKHLSVFILRQTVKEPPDSNLCRFSPKQKHQVSVKRKKNAEKRDKRNHSHDRPTRTRLRTDVYRERYTHVGSSERKRRKSSRVSSANINGP